MKFLVVHPGPQFSVHDVYVGWVEALRELGQHVAEYNLHDRLTFYSNQLSEAGEGRFKRSLTEDQVKELAINGLYAALYRMQPDVLMVVSGFYVPPELLELARRRGTAVVVVHTESPYEDRRQLELAEHASMNLLNDPVNIAAYQQFGPAVYMPHAYRPSVHHVGPALPELVSDFAFVGTGYASRVEFFEAMGLDGFEVMLAGNWQGLSPTSPLREYIGHELSECLDNASTADVYRSARAGINFYRREAQSPDLVDGWAMGPREVEMAACGLFFLRDPRGEGDETLWMLPTFESPAEAGELLRWYLANDGERTKLATAARDAIADRTFTHFAAALLRLIVN
jgi:hypothetical protein